MNRRYFLFLCVFVGVVVLIIGFVYGSSYSGMSRELENVTKLNFSLPGVKLIPNPTVNGLLDATVIVGKYASDTEISCVAIETLKRIASAKTGNISGFDTIRIQIKSGMWQTEFVFDFPLALEYFEERIDSREFWVETIKTQTPKREMINTNARVDTFREYVLALFNSKTIGKKISASFNVSAAKNLMVNLNVDSVDSVSELVSETIICMQVAAEVSGVYLDKVTIEVETKTTKTLIKFDYRYLDLLTDGKISLEEFRGHMYIE